MAARDEKLEEIIALLKEGNKLREETLDVAKQSLAKADEARKIHNEFQEKYQKHVFPYFRLLIPVSVIIFAVIIFLVYILIRFYLINPFI